MRLQDLSPLLEALTKISDGRILPGLDQNEEEGAILLRIPLRGISPGDRKDVQARRYIRAWIRENLPELKGRSITTAFREVDPHKVSWNLATGEVVPVRALLEVRIVEIKEGDIDRWKKGNQKRHAKAKRGFVDQLGTTTVRSSDS